MPLVRIILSLFLLRLAGQYTVQHLTGNAGHRLIQFSLWAFAFVGIDAQVRADVGIRLEGYRGRIEVPVTFCDNGPHPENKGLQTYGAIGAGTLAEGHDKMPRFTTGLVHEAQHLPKRMVT